MSAQAVSGMDVRRKNDGAGLQPHQVEMMRFDARLASLLDPSVPLALALASETAVHRDVSTPALCLLCYCAWRTIPSPSCFALNLGLRWLQFLCAWHKPCGLSCVADGACCNGTRIREGGHGG